MSLQHSHSDNVLFDAYETMDELVETVRRYAGELKDHPGSKQILIWAQDLQAHLLQGEMENLAHITLADLALLYRMVYDNLPRDNAEFFWEIVQAKAAASRSEAFSLALPFDDGDVLFQIMLCPKSRPPIYSAYVWMDIELRVTHDFPSFEDAMVWMAERIYMANGCQTMRQAKETIVAL